MTENHLIRLSLLFFKLNNEQDWDALRAAEWISPKFTAAIEYRANNQEGQVTLEQHIAQYSQHLKENPGYFETTSEVDAKIDQYGKSAQVFVNHVASNGSGDVSIPGVAVFSWRKVKGGEWRFEKMVDIRGIGPEMV